MLAFKKDSATYVMRINDKPVTTVVPHYHAIVWNFEFINTYTDWRVQNSPRFFHQDTQDKNTLFLFGRFEGNGYALKFNKDTA
jgi:hypothetical protein